MTVAAVEARGLVKRYRDVNALDGLDLDVPAGSVFGLIGPNGAGKTTTLLSLVTLLHPDQGTMSVFGLDPTREQRDVRRLVGWMPDFFGLYDGLSCREYLDFFADSFELPAAQRRRRVGDLLELVGLAHKGDTDVAGLSRGMQQRLGLARSLVHDPELLVLDEPASGLDPRARIELREVLRELSRQGKTILISSHVLADLAELCDRIGIVEAGKVLAQGTMDEIRSRAAGVVSVTVTVLGDATAVEAAARVAAAAGATVTQLSGTTLDADLPGGAEEAADLLTALVAGGVRVVAFTEEHTSLERLFMTVTEGIVR